MTNRELVELAKKCAHQDRHAQKRLYEHFKSKMFVVCQCYASNRQDAEDLLQEGFLLVFRDIATFREEGSLEGWIRRIFVNVALQYIQKERKRNTNQEEYLQDYSAVDEHENLEISDEDILPQLLIQHLQNMPPGFRTVLNLYILENFSHKQIAEKMGVSEGTSRSQLNRAKAYLKNLIEKKLTQ